MEDALARARRLGYLDDAAFARVVATRRSQTHGPAVIAAELTSKGVGRDLVREALGEVSREHLVAAARRLAGRAGGADPRRVAGRPLRRGFSSDVVREALDGDVDP